MGNITNNKSNGKTYCRLSATVDNQLKRVSLGSGLSKPAQIAILAVVGRLEEANAYGQKPDRRTQDALAQLPENIQNKLAKIGLIESDERPKLLAFLDDYVRRKSVRVKPATMRTDMQTVRRLKSHFGDVDLTAITIADAEDFVTEMMEDLAEATVARHVIRCRTIFNDAVRRRVIEESVWKEIEVGSQTGQVTILEPDLLNKLVDGMPDTEWKALVAIYRYLGCRRGEALLLKWTDIDWENHRITITSPKTEHHKGGASRVVPMFPALRPYLDALWDETPEGMTYLFNGIVNDSNRSGDDIRNIGAAFRHRAKAIGVDVTWKPIQAFRQTRENELIRKNFAAHLVHAWIGHDAVTAAKHYLEVTGADFDRAAGIVRETTVTESRDFGLSFGTNPNGTEGNAKAFGRVWTEEQVKTVLIPRISGAISGKLGVTGFEPVTSSV